MKSLLRTVKYQLPQESDPEEAHGDYVVFDEDFLVLVCSNCRQSYGIVIQEEVCFN